MVAPLRFGGGTRLKILESLARGVPVVTTGVGCEGLGVEDGQEALVADDADAFAAAADRLLDDTTLCDTLARAGRAMAEARFDWPKIGAELDRALRDGTGGRVPDVSRPPGAAP
jgi:glycosyltransferase involved in cell wall biosynthesis